MEELVDKFGVLIVNKIFKFYHLFPCQYQYCAQDSSHLVFSAPEPVGSESDYGPSGPQSSDDLDTSY